MDDPLRALDEIARQDQARAARRRRLRDGWRALWSWGSSPGDPARPARTVVSPWQSGRVAVVVLGGALAVPVAWQAGGSAAGLAVLAAALGLLAAHRAEQWWWRRRLPFRLVGFDEIGGEQGSVSEDETSYVACELRVHLVEPGAGTDAVRRALLLLADRLREAQAGTSRFEVTPARAWRVEGAVLRGELDGRLWGDRWLEQWLRREAVLLHRAHPIREVVVDARYTGSAYFDP
jgi:hypothetical protein